MPVSIQRVLLGLLFVLLATLQTSASYNTFRFLAHQTVHMPLSFDLDTGEVTDTSDLAKQAGIRDKDVLLTIAGCPVSSLVGAYRAFLSYKPGDMAEFTFRRGSGQPFPVRFQVPDRPASDISGASLLLSFNVLRPWLALLLGFLVAFRRPGDPVAYSLLALMICVSKMLSANSWLQYGGSPFFTWSNLFLNHFAINAVPAAWTWFAMEFPDPRSRHRVLPRFFAWFGSIYLVVVIIESLVVAARGNGVHTLDPIHRALDTNTNNLAFIPFALMGLGFANFLNKLWKETRPDLRRRLRWILAGLSVGFLPAVVWILWEEVTGNDYEQTPMLARMIVILTPLLVPITLGYAVLVDRLFDVGVFIRQGLIASKFVAAIRVVLLGILLFVMVNAITNREMGRTERWGQIAGCAGAIIGTRRATDGLRHWVDRRFFQEAVNTELILSELSSEVRRITDPQVLLRTVTERIESALHVSRIVFTPAYAGLPFEAPVVARLRTDHRPIALADNLLLPIATEKDLHGVVTLGPKKSEEPYSGSDLRLLESVANQTALALENGRLAAAVAEEAAQRERITSELEIARQVQERLFPKSAPKVAGLDLAGRCKPAQTVGGDYFDFLGTRDGRIGLAIGDVAGKGVPAALLMAGLQASLRGLMLAGQSEPAELMTNLNILVYDASPANRFATFLFGLYDPATRMLHYCSAGHNPALLYRPSSDETFWLKTPGIALGLRRRSVYQQAEIQLEPGDVLVLYTDGISEARNPAGDEFGEAAVREQLTAGPTESARAVLDHLIAVTERFAGEAPQHDDITAIVGLVQ